MKRSMTRWTLAACMALAALGAVAVFDAATATAEAAPNVSPFAGTYFGGVPRNSHPSWSIKISDRGRVTGSYSDGERTNNGSVSGEVSADGSYTLEVSTTYFAGKDHSGRVGTKSGWVSWSYTVAGQMALNADGDLAGTAGVWGSFVWLRQSGRRETVRRTVS